jgi:hypothetical protein
VAGTLYLDVQIEELAHIEDAQSVARFQRKLRESCNCITRVALSSDSNIPFGVVTAYDPMHRFFIRIVSYLDDVKSLHYMRISNSDYESRILAEVIDSSRSEFVQNKHDISIDEFVGRLIASRLNSSQAVEITARYVDVKNKTLFLGLLHVYDETKIQLFEDFLRKQFRNYSKKYRGVLDSVEVLDTEGNKIMWVS